MIGLDAPRPAYTMDGDLARFYETALEIGPYERPPVHMGCRVGEVYLGFDQAEGPLSPGRDASLWFTVDDVQSAFDRLVAQGCPGDVPTQKPWGGLLAAVYDPDGNMLDLSQRRTAEDPPGA